MAEKNLQTRIILRNDVAVNWENSEIILKKGEVAIATDTNIFKIGDGEHKWSEIETKFVSYAAVMEAINAATESLHTMEVYEASVEKGADKVAALNEVATAPEKGDVGIVKEAIADGKVQYTAYAYNGTDWAAMDGNYDAENVYFSTDLMYTKAIGELAAVPSTGSATLAAKGKNVKDIFTAILAKRSQPSKSEPAVTLGGTQGNQDVEIGTTITKSGTMTAALSAGSYTYGPATGITATGWTTKVEYTSGKSGEIASGTSNSLAYNYSFQLGTDGTTVAVKYSAAATHDAGTIANDSFGDESSPNVQIAAGSKSKTATATYSSYRKMFYGTRTDVEDLDSDKIRALSSEKAAAKANNSLSVSVPVGAKRVIVAVPAGRTMTSCKDVNDSSAEILSAWVSQTVAVEGAEGYEAINYTVYVNDYANPAAAANTYKITIA